MIGKGEEGSIHRGSVGEGADWPGAPSRPAETALHRGGGENGLALSQEVLSRSLPARRQSIKSPAKTASGVPALAADGVEAITLDLEELPVITERSAHSGTKRCSLKTPAVTLQCNSLRPRRTPSRHSVTPNIPGAHISPCSATPRCRWSRADARRVGRCGGAADGRGGCKGAVLQPPHRRTNDGPLGIRGRLGAAGDTGHMR